MKEISTPGFGGPPSTSAAPGHTGKRIRFLDDGTSEEANEPKSKQHRKRNKFAGAEDGGRKAPGPSKEELLLRKAQLEPERRALPIWSAREKLVSMAKDHPVLIVIGETGSGKTTQIPQMLLDSGLAGSKAVVCTQPRRVAAVTVARRVAEERGAELGKEVGYAVRFEDVSDSRVTRLKYCTDGLLLREALSDNLLSRYGVVIVDEAHERTVQTDVLMGLLKGVAARRPAGSFRLLIMSATLEAKKFSEYFGGAPTAYVQGRQYPVEVLYLPETPYDYVGAAVDAALQLHCEEPADGDALVFLTGQDEIESAERLLADKGKALPKLDPPLPQLIIAPLYSALPPEMQMKAFEPAPEGYRKIILATNIAETSVTINGVRYVVDSGMVKARAYSAKAGYDSLQVVPVSQAQARQRSGRAGREAPGRCYRLFTEDSFQALQKATAPEILRTNLASVVLQLKALGVKDVLNFDFIDPPPKPALARALELLLALGALDPSTGHLTPLGAKLGRLPLDPMYGKALLASAELGCSKEALGVIAMASAENIFFSPQGKKKEAEEAKRRFVSPGEGDHVTLLAVYRAYLSVPARERGAFCSDCFVNPRSMRKVLEIADQLKALMVELEIAMASCGDDLVPLRKALTAGLFPHAARLQPDGSYRVLASGQSVYLHPSSASHGKKPECIVFAELVRTSREYARSVTVIEQPWLPELAPEFFSAVTRAPPPAANANDARENIGAGPSGNHQARTSAGPGNMKGVAGSRGRNGAGAPSPHGHHHGQGHGKGKHSHSPGVRGAGRAGASPGGRAHGEPTAIARSTGIRINI